MYFWEKVSEDMKNYQKTCQKMHVAVLLACYLIFSSSSDPYAWEWINWSVCIIPFHLFLYYNAEGHCYIHRKSWAFVSIVLKHFFLFLFFLQHFIVYFFLSYKKVLNTILKNKQTQKLKKYTHFGSFCQWDSLLAISFSNAEISYICIGLYKYFIWWLANFVTYKK